MDPETEYAEFAGLIDHALLAPTLSVQQLEAGLGLARAYRVASVCVLPFYLPRTKSVLEGSEVRASTTIGFPHGAQASRVKRHEAVCALDDGAVELDMVVNVSQVLSGSWTYVRDEVRDVTSLCHDRGAKLKLIFENAYLETRHKERLCVLSGELGVDWVKTSTGFAPSGATLDDVMLMRRHSPPAVAVKASGGIRTLESVLELRPWVTRIGTSHTQTILEGLRSRLGLAPLSSSVAPGGAY
jgi:deoxyribose-phosphate aldolase